LSASSLAELCIHVNFLIPVADELNHRVLFFAAGNTTASRVYGQSSFTTCGAGCTATSMNQPSGVALDSSNNLYGQQRVVLLQGCSAGTWLKPTMLVQCVYSLCRCAVTDGANHRVLFFPAGSTTATRVYGQSTFTSGTANAGGPVSAKTLNTPMGIAVDSSGRLFVADAYNHRVLVFS
jgi:hypothetical protein